MRFPKVYVSSRFLDEMDKYADRYKDSSIFDLDEELNQQRESLKRIRTLFLSSVFQTDIKSSEIEEFKESEFLYFSSFKNILLRRLVMNSGIGDKPNLIPDLKSQDFDQINCSFFLSQSNKHCTDYSEKHGKIVLGKSFLESPFFLNHSFSVESTSKEIPQAERIAHPCSSLIIIDPYLLQNKGKPFQKVDNLIRFFRIFLPKNLKKPFEIDIVTSNPDNKNIKRLDEQLLEEIALPISLHIYFPPIDIFKESDRYFITDYSITVIGHPLDRDSYISSNFLPSNHSNQGIQNGMELWFKKIKSVKNMIETLKLKSESESYCYKFKYPKPTEIEDSSGSEEVEHRIFNI